MKIEITTGCTLDSLRIDGIEEIEMTDEQRRAALEKIGEYIKTLPTNQLNYLLQYLHCFIDEDAFEHEDLGYCSQCGDYAERRTLEID